MRIEITHSTRYTYSSPVLLEPHSLRVKPRHDAAQQIQTFDLEVFPQPLGRSEFVDLDGNSVIRVWFSEAVPALELKSHSVIDTTRDDPFDFLLQAGATSLPVRWSTQEDRHLAIYRMRRQPSRPVDELVACILDEVGHVTTLFLTTLSRRIAETCRHIRRPMGEPNAPSVTLIRQAGACRDLAVLFLDAARAAGLPARFVSGYLAAAAAEPSLHAWAEVFLPGAGWRGFDPSQGLAVADRHVAVCAAADPGDAYVVDGTFLGSEVVSNLQADIDLHLPLAASA